MAILEELVAVLGWEIEGEENRRRFQQGIDETGNKLGNFAKNAAGVAAGVAAAATAAAGALFAFVGPVANQFDEMVKAADRLSVGFDELQELGFAAEQSGGSIDGMTSSLRNLDMRLAEAARGTGRAKRVLDDYGLSATDAAGNTKTGADFLMELAEVAEDLSTQELQDIARSFGLDQATVTLISQGREEIGKLREEKRQLGIIDEEAARQAEEYNDRLNELSHIWNHMRNQLALNLLPVMTSWIERGRDWIMVNRELIQERLDQALQFTARGIENVGNVAMAAGRSVRWLSEQIESLTGIGTGAQLAILGAGAAALLATRHPVLASIGALLIAIDDIRAFVEGEDSALGWALDGLEKALNDLGIEFESWGSLAEAAVQPVVDEFRALRDIIEELIDLIPKIPEVPRIELPGGLGEVRPGPLGSGDLGSAAFGFLRDSAQDSDPNTAIDAIRTWWQTRNNILQTLRDLVIGEAGASEAPSQWGAGASMVPAITGAPHPEGDTVEFLRNIQGALDQISSGIDSFKPGDTHFHRNVDFDQTNNVTINQNVAGEASASAAGQAVGRATEDAGRRAADIAAQEPSLDSLPPI